MKLYVHMRQTVSPHGWVGTAVIMDVYSKKSACMKVVREKNDSPYCQSHHYMVIRALREL